MKRHLFLILLMYFSTVPIFAQFSGNGSGTSSHPYLITNAAQLDEVRNFLGDQSVYFKLESDLDLESYISEQYPSTGWLPIGDSSSPFEGYFDGNGKVIKGLTINRTSMDYVGLFGLVKYGTIKKLLIDRCDIKGKNDVGGLCGHIEETAYVTECGATGTISGSFTIGGLIGCMTGSRTSYPAIDNCFFDGGVSGTGGTYCSTGGLVGYNHFGGITKCYAAGTVNSSYHVGGISGTLENTGSPAPGYVTNCMAANTKLWGSYWTGRIIGQYNNYSYVSGGNKAYSGMEIYFGGSTTPRDNVYDGCNSTNGTDNGTGVSWDATMQASTYTSMGWDFSSIWTIDEGTSLPYFVWSKAPEFYDLTISSYGLSTLYLDYPVAIPYDEYEPHLLGVYYAFEIQNKEVKLARLNDYIPAKTAVIVQGNSGTYRFTETRSDPGTLKYNNLLKGSSTNITADQAKEGASSDAVIMMLGKGGNGYIGFYQYTRQVIPANKAYIVYEDAQQADALSLGLDTGGTGIQEIAADDRADEWYTLQGVKLPSNRVPQRGLYIHHGKKVFIK